MALEFRSHKDGAWYEARLLMEYAVGDRRLRIKFATFSNDEDELVNAKDLKTLQDVDALRSRVRKVSIQLQDYECSRVKKGLVVCAARSFQPDDRRFYDALIDRVVRKNHGYEGGEEVCACRFVVEWISGPDVGIQTTLALEDICRVQAGKLPTTDEEISPVLSSFLDRAKEKIENTFSNSTTTSVEKGACDSGTSKPRNRFKASSALGFSKNTPAKRYLAEMIGNPSERSGSDMDIGGVPHVLLVENVEKGISPVTIMQFLYQQVSVSCRAFVMPSTQSESYTRGIIILDNKRNLEKLSNFLESPDRIIVSSRGRPWVVPQKKLLDDTLRAMTEVFRHTSQTALDDRTLSSNELKVVIYGSQEYQKAKKLKNLFKKFVDHQCRIHKRLLYEEAEISKLPI